MSSAYGAGVADGMGTSARPCHRSNQQVSMEGCSAGAAGVSSNQLELSRAAASSAAVSRCAMLAGQHVPCSAACQSKCAALSIGVSNLASCV